MKLKLTAAVLSCAMAILLAMGLTAAEEPKPRSPLEGFWMWSFTNADGAQVAPRIRFKTKEDVLTGTSRFRPGSETPVTNLIFKGNQLSFDVVRENDGETVITHYAGKLSGDTITGKVTAKSDGGEQSYDWIARRPVGVDGTWTISVDLGGEYPMESRLTLKQEGEKVTGKLRGFRGESDIHKGKFKDGKISFDVERAGRGGDKSTNHYRGKLVNDQMVGTVEMNRFGGGGRQTNDWDAVRAD